MNQIVLLAGATIILILGIPIALQFHDFSYIAVVLGLVTIVLSIEE